jgi:sporulation protein YlmC with PRC-barrel domain
MMKRTLTAAALVAALAAPAFAQTTDNKMPAPSAGMPAMSAPAKDGFVQEQQSTDWRASKVIGATVYGPDNASIGEVNDVLIGNDGKIRAAVIGVGGFLGVGEKSVAIPFESLNITRKPDSSTIQKINVTYTKDQLKGAPSFAYYEPASAATTGSGLNGAKPMTPATAPKN